MIVRRVPPVPSQALVECYEILRGRGYTVTEDIAEEVIQRSDLAKSVAGRHGEITDEIRKISQRVGEVCGLGLYGLDIIESDRGPYVVDVNYFPGYKGVPNAAGMIADYIDDYAGGKATLTPPVKE